MEKKMESFKEIFKTMTIVMPMLILTIILKVILDDSVDVKSFGNKKIVEMVTMIFIVGIVFLNHLMKKIQEKTSLFTITEKLLILSSGCFVLIYALEIEGLKFDPSHYIEILKIISIFSFFISMLTIQFPLLISNEKEKIITKEIENNLYIKSFIVVFPFLISIIPSYDSIKYISILFIAICLFRSIIPFWIMTFKRDRNKLKKEAPYYYINVYIMMIITLFLDNNIEDMSLFLLEFISFILFSFVFLNTYLIKTIKIKPLKHTKINRKAFNKIELVFSTIFIIIFIHTFYALYNIKENDEIFVLTLTSFLIALSFIHSFLLNDWLALTTDERVLRKIKYNHKNSRKDNYTSSIKKDVPNFYSVCHLIDKNFNLNQISQDFFKKEITDEGKIFLKIIARRTGKNYQIDTKLEKMFVLDSLLELNDDLISDSFKMDIFLILMDSLDFKELIEKDIYKDLIKNTITKENLEKNIYLQYLIIKNLDLIKEKNNEYILNTLKNSSFYKKHHFENKKLIEKDDVLLVDSDKSLIKSFDNKLNEINLEDNKHKYPIDKYAFFKYNDLLIDIDTRGKESEILKNYEFINCINNTLIFKTKNGALKAIYL